MAGWGVPGQNEPLPDRLNAVDVNIVSDDGEQYAMRVHVTHFLTMLTYIFTVEIRIFCALKQRQNIMLQ